MQALKFRLSGKTAFFKQPDVNSYLYFTYGNIHKPALLGLLGAVMGYKGYNQLSMENAMSKEKNKKFLPEYYEKLKDLKISITPLNKKGYIPRKIQKFNNSVGYASKEQGGNLIVTEQWLENPEWEIRVLLDSKEAEKIKDQILNKRAVYIPYLGKNDHTAKIDQAELEELTEIVEKDNIKINSLFPLEQGEILPAKYQRNAAAQETGFIYKEDLPVCINENSNQYEKAEFGFTNQFVEADKMHNLYSDETGNYVFL